MITAVKGFALDGIEGYPVIVEVSAQKGLPAYEMVGLAIGAVKESKERVRSAIETSGFDIGGHHIIVNLAPSDVKKDGSALDLAIAVGILTATGYIQHKPCEEYVFLGELGLDGSLRRINGVMPIIISALQAGYRKFVIPRGNGNEASFIPDAEVYALENLSDVIMLMVGISVPRQEKSSFRYEERAPYDVDMSDVKGQAMAKRALEIAVSGGHNLLMCGAPGTGKTMLAKCVPGIMPRMTFEEAIEVTKIHSVGGLIGEDEGIIKYRPFRSPHHTASLAGITGGGKNVTPGEVSLAHNGVLFLDEMPEYPRQILEALRQPLEDNVITVSRVNKTVEYPADFMLIAGMNPCPCGYYGSTVKKCTCTPREINRYVSRISGPLLDRIDIFVTVDNIEYGDFRSKRVPESSETVRARVEAAREIQRERFAPYGIRTNSQMNNSLISKFCRLDSDEEELLGQVFDGNRLSPRATVRILKTARTIADLAGHDEITNDDLLEAIQYKTVDKKELTAF